MNSAPVSSASATAFSLLGRTALITGAGRGLGRSIAIAFADAGADVALLSRTETELTTLAEVISNSGRRAFVLPCDVTDQRQLDEAVASLPALDIVVASAGTNVPQPLVDVDEETYGLIFDTNVRAAFFTAQRAVRRMLADGVKGSVLFVSSQMGHVGASNRSVYCASKHAIEGLTKALAVELAPAGIRVNALAPTYIRTPLTQPFLEDSTFAASVEAAIPLGRIGEPADVVGAAVYLSSPAAGLVTGTSLLIDGGYTAQ